MSSGFNIFVPFHHAFLVVSSDAPTCLDAYTAPGTLYDTWYNTLHTVRLIIRQAEWYTLPNTTQYTTSYATRHTPYTVHRTSYTTHDTSYIKHDRTHHTNKGKKNKKTQQQIDNNKKQRPETLKKKRKTKRQNNNKMRTKANGDNGRKWGDT